MKDLTNIIKLSKEIDSYDLEIEELERQKEKLETQLLNIQSKIKLCNFQKRVATKLLIKEIEK